MKEHVVIWDGITRPESVDSEYRKIREQLADAAYARNWETVLHLLGENPTMVNATRLGGSSRYTPLHQAAYHGAPIDVVENLLNLGAWRTLRNKDGQRPVDLARVKNHAHLYRILEPVYHWEISSQKLQGLQRNFHEVIRGRAEKQIESHQLRLPELEPMLESGPSCKFWFAVPGMYGGFNYWLEKRWDRVLLISESWCRVVGGSGERHVVTPFGNVLVDEGFV